METLFHNREAKAYHLKNKCNSATYTDGFTEAQLQILQGMRCEHFLIKASMTKEQW